MKQDFSGSSVSDASKIYLSHDLTAMNRIKLFLLSCLQLLFALTIRASDRKPNIGPIPSWATTISVDYSNKLLDQEAEDGYSDLHFEKQVSLAQRASFYHKALRVLTETGVENLSQLSVEYDPSFEQLTFHSVRVLRNGQSLNKLNLAQIKTLQQEKELESSIYNGTLTAMIVLEDLRKGDVLEYSYTLTGFNPAFRNKYAASYATQFDVPVYGLYYRLLVPDGKHVTVANSLTTLKPVVTKRFGETEYLWLQRNLQPLPPIEKDIPGWYDPYPGILISEFNSWKEVNDWALELFPLITPVSAGLQKKIDEIKDAYTSKEDRLLTTLRFVQDEIRYTGFEDGENSHKPHDPSKVFQQRFGDCKDKAYLFCTMLRAMGIQAYPVLINTGYKKAIASWLPAPNVFDHTTTCVELAGKTYWFDVTIAHQRGQLNDISFPDYQIGLIVKPGTIGFSAIPLQNNGKSKTREIFEVKSVDAPVKLVVVTEFSGSHADDVRYSFQSKSIKEIQKDYKDYYKAYFKKIEADSLRYQDNEKTGVFTTTEYYTIRDFWQENGSAHAKTLQPFVIDGAIRKPEEERKMPFALTYPARYEEEIELHLPQDWPITESSNRFGNDAFSFSCDYIQQKSNVVLLSYRFENRTDHVPANEISDYLNEWKLAENSMGFTLSDNFENRTVKSKPITLDRDSKFATVYFLLGICVLGTILYKRYTNKPSV